MIVTVPYKFLHRRFVYTFFKFCPKFLYGFVLKLLHKAFLHKRLDLKKPISLSEKLQWIKIFEKDERKSLLTDKIYAKNYVQKHFPELKVAKIIDVKKKFEDLSFELFPNSFVIKTNHAWKTNLLVENKVDFLKSDYKKYSKYFKKILKLNFSFSGFLELQYQDISPQIFVEEYLGNGQFEQFKDYEVYCFNGKPEFIRLSIFAENQEEKFIKFYHYDANWEKTNFTLFENKNFEIEKPINFDKIISYSKFLSKDFNFVRIDFMECNNVLYFGEFTFTPFSGFIKFSPDYYNDYYGNKLVL